MCVCVYVPGLGDWLVGEYKGLEVMNCLRSPPLQLKRILLFSLVHLTRFF